MKLGLFAAVSVLSMMAASVAFALDQNLPAYQPAAGITGQLKSVGSDTLDRQMEAWAKGFQRFYPEVKIEVEGRGSATAPEALVEGTAQFGPMSRFMSAGEAEKFEKKFGYKVSNFRVAIDALAIYVNKDNPIPCLAMQQVDRIFSATRKGSGGRSIVTWGDAGLTGEWASKPIVIYGRNSISGTHDFFRQIVLYDGDFKPDVNQEPSSEAVVQHVAEDKFAIGYSGIAFKTDGVRAAPLSVNPGGQLSVNPGGQCHNATLEETIGGKYPIARYLYVYLNKKPDEQLDPLRAEFVKYILSRDGQALVEQEGYYSLTNEIREAELRKLGLSPPER
ncbi:PstS family phosphate ABC transporter substrate-binding protein [Rhodoblastus sp.]|uniref:PstS family phosphate ABC transporter substrate-binding protein n=1 Tax=Rhodoblastus sp. TaxID=1962975 RepID=UPI003F985D69